VLGGGVRVGVDDSFFHLGGDSLSAMRLIFAINVTFDIRLSVRTVFDAPSVRSLSKWLSRHPMLRFGPDQRGQFCIEIVRDPKELR
jgi:hypothetical protein